MLKRKMSLVVILVLGWLVASCAKSPATTTPMPTATSTPMSSPTATATATPIPLPAATLVLPDLGPLPTPPPTAAPEEVSVELVGVISSEPNWVTDYKGVADPALDTPLYSYFAVTLYITEVMQGQEYIQSGDTIILHDYHHLSPVFSPEQLRSEMVGMAFHIRGSYQADIGVMPWAEIIKDSGKTTIYEPPPIVGESGDIVRVVVKFMPRAVSVAPGTQVTGFPNQAPVLRLVDMNWAQVITGTVRLGEIIGTPELLGVEVLKTVP